MRASALFFVLVLGFTGLEGIIMALVEIAITTVILV